MHVKINLFLVFSEPGTIFEAGYMVKNYLHLITKLKITIFFNSALSIYDLCLYWGTYIFNPGFLDDQDN